MGKTTRAPRLVLRAHIGLARPRISGQVFQSSPSVSASLNSASDQSKTSNQYGYNRTQERGPTLVLRRRKRCEASRLDHGRDCGSQHVRQCCFGDRQGTQGASMPMKPTASPMLISCQDGFERGDPPLSQSYLLGRSHRSLLRYGRLRHRLDWQLLCFPSLQ